MRKTSITTQLFNSTDFQDTLRRKFHLDDLGNLVGPLGKPLLGFNNGLGYRLIGVTFQGKQTAILAHRLVFFLGHGRVPGEIDHIDNDKSNNNLHNLRETTHSQNLGYMPKQTHRPSSSQYKGVQWHKRSQKWIAKIANQYVGSFTCEAEAALAYDEAAKRHFGPDCWVNFPEGRPE